MTTPASFSIVSDGPRTSITVNGQDISHLTRGARATYEPNALPHVEVDLVPRAGGLSGLGNVTINRAPEDIAADWNSLRATQIAWLRGIASSPELHDEVQAKLQSISADPVAATANCIADLLEQMGRE